MMKYFSTKKAKLRGWRRLSGFVGPYKIVESGNSIFSLVTCDHQSKTHSMSYVHGNTLKTCAGLYVHFYIDINDVSSAIMLARLS